MFAAPPLQGRHLPECSHAAQRPAGRYSIKQLTLHTKSWARDNTSGTTSMFSDYKFVDYCVMSILVVATPFSHRKINIYRIFSCPFKALVRGRVIVVAKK